MEVRDGFIVSIFNYCDSWCAACPFTSRCRVFANIARLEASFDPALKNVVEAPPLEEDLPAARPDWMMERIQEMNEAANAECEPERRVPLEHLAIEARAGRYGDEVHGWLAARNLLAASDPRDPRAVIGWFSTLLPAKIHRALRGLAEDDPHTRDWPADHDGSAKVALLGIERSHAAWLDLVEGGMASEVEVRSFIDDLVWFGDALDRVFPNARAFVRPAFDEPDEVAKLVAQENGAR